MFIGLTLALISGMSLGGITSFAALAYLNGAAPLTLIALRGLVAALMMLGLAFATRAPLWPGRDGIRHIIAVGLSLSMVGFGLMGSVAYISPGLAVAVLYLYPIMVLVADSLRTRTMPAPLAIIGFGVALLGIVTCVGAVGLMPVEVASVEANPLGLGLAFMAAVGMASFLITTAAANRAANRAAHQASHDLVSHDQAYNDTSRPNWGGSIVIWANMMVISFAVIFILYAGQTGPETGPEAATPTNLTGWFAIFMAAALYAIGIIASVLALKHITAPTVALIMNIEPITTLLMAHLVVGEVLSPLQYSGMICAVLGIIIGSRALKRT